MKTDAPALPTTGLAKLREMVSEGLERAPGRAYMLKAMREMIVEYELMEMQRDTLKRIARDALRNRT